jgi:arylsulfatase A-like enzyme
MREKAVDVIRRAASTPEPFFLYLSTFAPHEPATPAPRHAELFPDLLKPKSPAFNEADVSDKPFGIRNDPPLSEANLVKIEQLYRLRVQSVQAIDEMLPALFDALRESGQLENTYIFFTSDNGFHLGDHRQFIGKGSPYEEDIRVPFIVFGPGVQAGASIDHLAAAVDWAPTIADLAGVIPPEFVDGRSLAPLFDQNRPQQQDWRQAALLEFYGFQVDAPPVTGPVFFGLRTDDYLFVRYSDDFLEFYNLRNDPYQLENIAGDLTAGQIEALSAQAEALFTCVGESCAEIEDRAVEVALP